MLRRIAFLATAVSLLIVGVAPAMASPASVEKIPLTISQFGLDDIGACVGEEVAVTGGYFTVVTKTDGTSPWVFHRNVSQGEVTGVDTGIVYGVQGHIQDVWLPDTGSETYELTLKSVSSQTGNFMAQFLFHITFDANGEVTAFTSDFTITCI